MPSRNLKVLVLTAALLLGVVAFAGQEGAADRSARTGAAPIAAPSPANSAHPVDQFDRVVQQRFHNVIGFGMARIASERKFEPETKEEKEAVKDLRRAGYRMGLFLAGRGVLEPFPEEFRASKTYFGFGNHMMSGPVFIRSTKRKDLPNGSALWELARRALVAFGEGAERQSFTVGRWEVEARPVRASSETCLQCHKTDIKLEVTHTAKGPIYGWGPKGNVLRVGDPLGALLYVYKKKSR